MCFISKCEKRTNVSLTEYPHLILLNIISRIWQMGRRSEHYTALSILDFVLLSNIVFRVSCRTLTDKSFYELCADSRTGESIVIYW